MSPWGALHNPFLLPTCQVRTMTMPASQAAMGRNSLTVLVDLSTQSVFYHHYGYPHWTTGFCVSPVHCSGYFIW